MKKAPRWIWLGLFLNLTTLPAQSRDWVVEVAGTLEHPDLKEASGIAPSRLYQNVAWLINDSGNGPFLFAINRQGKHLAKVEVEGIPNRDWEDLASFTWKKKSYLLIGDIGDNSAKRTSARLYLVPEPRFREGKLIDRKVRPVQTIHFTYEDGPRDAEGIAVDLQSERIMILSKREQIPAFYEIPLLWNKPKKPVVARRTGLWNTRQTLSRLIRVEPSIPLIGSMPTALDLTADGRRLLVLDYNRPWLLDRTKPHARPEPLPVHRLAQAESACFSFDGSEIWVTTEQRPAKLLIYRRASSASP